MDFQRRGSTDVVLYDMVEGVVYLIIEFGYENLRLRMSWLTTYRCHCIRLNHPGSRLVTLNFQVLCMSDWNKKNKKKTCERFETTPLPAYTLSCPPRVNFSSLKLSSILTARSPRLSPLSLLTITNLSQLQD